MNADTESNVDTARSRAERLIERGRARAGRRVRLRAHRRDRAGGGAARRSAHRQHRRGAADHRAGLQVRVPQLPARARDRQATGWSLLGDIFARGEGRSRRRPCSCTSTTRSGNRWPRASRRCCPRCRSPFKLLDTIPYDPAAKDLTVEVSKAKATNAELLLLVCRLNDAIVLRREMVKQRWSPMGVVSPGSPGLYEEQFAKALGKYAEYCITNTVWFNPKNEITQPFAAAFKKRFPKDESRVSRHQRDLHLRRDPDRGRRVQARARAPIRKALADAIRADEHRRHRSQSPWAGRSSSTPRVRSRATGPS